MTNLQLNESPHIHIPDCTNFDLSQLEQLYFRMDLYETLQSTYSDMRRLTIPNDSAHHKIYYCAWMNDRVLEKCAEQNMYYGHRDTLNMLCNPDRQCDPQLCTTTSA